MRVEGGLPDGSRREPAELASSKGNAGKSSSTRKNKKRQKKKTQPAPIHKLFEACREVFSHGGTGVVPSPEEVERLCSVLGQIKPANVGLNRNMLHFENVGSKERPPVTYLRLHECDRFSICIFCLPQSAVIPLHNHPRMTVFSKLLFGSMHIKSYDWAESPDQDKHEASSSRTARPPGVRLAKVEADAIFKAPCHTSVLYPAAGGNMHRFTALTPCAVLDVLGPPYSDEDSRPCTYYNDFPYARFAGDSASASGDGEVYAWLEQREKPDDFFFVWGKYSGPVIVDS